MRSLIVLLLLSSCVAGSVSRSPAWDGSLDAASFPAAPPGQEASAPEEQEEPKNMVGLFVGVTAEEDASSGSFGVEYERRLSDLVGVGLVLELTPVLQDRLVTAPALYLHPVGGLFVCLAPGAVNQDGSNSFLFRTGVGWEFELGGSFSLAPEVNYDLVSGSENALVYGVALVHSF